MNIAQAVLLADGFGMHGSGWWVLIMVPVMLLCMGGMMWMMMRGMGGGSSERSSAPWERFVTRETPLETLERRFAAGEISVEDYRARREVLVDAAAEANGSHKDEALTTPAPEGRQ